MNAVTTDPLPENEVLKSLIPLQLDALHALWNLVYATRENAQPAPARKYSVPFLPTEALRLFHIGTLI